MSLTREQWSDMWASIKYIEVQTKYFTGVQKRLILAEIAKIKNQIQQVIGQME